MSFDRLSSIIDSLNDKYISFWGKVSNIESPTSYKAGIDAVGEQFIDEYARISSLPEAAKRLAAVALYI